MSEWTAWKCPQCGEEQSGSRPFDGSLCRRCYSKERIGDWMQTANGRQFWPLDPRADEVHIDDIAHALANQCRFAGHCREFYSVAQHSVLVSFQVPAEDALWGLLHDASEAYLVDLPRPVKRASEIGAAYMRAETAVMAAICDHFGLPREEPSSIKEADNVILMTEVRDIMAPPPAPWRASGVKPLPLSIMTWTPGQARRRFFDRFEELMRLRKMIAD